jgi:phosphoserine phosphatase
MPPRWDLTTFDIDGTLTRVHGWFVLAERVHRLPEYERSNRRFFAHEIGEDEHLLDLLRLSEGLRRAELAEILESTPRIGGIREAVSAWHERGTRVALLTHNPDFVCEWYAERFGFDGFAGTTVGGPPGEPIRLPPGVHADKISGLRELCERWELPPTRVAHVGDGWADARVFPLVGAGVALNSTLPEVREAADLCVDTDDIRELPTELDLVLPRPRPVPTSFHE